MNKKTLRMKRAPLTNELTKKRIILGILFLVFLAGCTPALKDLPQRLSATDSGNIWFASAGSLVRHPSYQTILTDGNPVVISGELRFPQGTGPFPAVILAHGCSGVRSTQIAWASVLREWGYATFIFDSFSSRSLSEVCTNPRTLTQFQRIPDAYGALRILVKHPKIDGRRVALMGFSHGGGLTLGASTEWAKEKYAPEGHPAFRVFFALYPGQCESIYPQRERISAPLRIHAGELDNWTPASRCKKLVESLIASGQDAAITIYPEAHHGFDMIGQDLVSYPAAVKYKEECTAEFADILGPLLTPPDKYKNCLGSGAMTGYNFEATEQARRNVRIQLGELMK